MVDRLNMYLFAFEKDKKSLLNELETLKTKYAERDNEALRLQELLERVQADKNKLSRRVSKLVLNGNSFWRFFSFRIILVLFRRKRSSPGITKMSSYDQGSNADGLRCIRKKTVPSSSSWYSSEECRRRTWHVSKWNRNSSKTTQRTFTSDVVVIAIAITFTWSFRLTHTWFTCKCSSGYGNITCHAIEQTISKWRKYFTDTLYSLWNQSSSSIADEGKTNSRRSGDSLNARNLGFDGLWNSIESFGRRTRSFSKRIE